VIKLLVVDDSPLMRRLLGELFAAEGDFEVAFARDGVEALAALGTFQPDVITLDVQMPKMDGLECLDRIMVQRPTPVVMASSVTVEGAAEALRAIDLGAVDVIAKPTGAVSLRMAEFGPALVQKVRAAAQARLPKAHRLRDRIRAKSRTAPHTLPRTQKRTPAPSRRGAEGERLVVVGASTGGPPALDALLGPLPADFPAPIVIAQHMPAAFTAALARRLNGLTALEVVEVGEPMPIEPGGAYLARGDADIIISRRGQHLFALSAPSSPSYHWRPSVDRLVDSAMDQVAASGIVGVLMTGMGSDGAAAMTRLREAGGTTLAESEATAVVWGMPGELVRAGGASAVADLPDLAACLTDMVGAP
jgi:two-component system chemotaxis response regulator CheB